MKGTVNEEVGMQKQQSCVHCLPFPFLLPFTVSMCLLMLKVRAGEAVGKEKIWAATALAAELLGCTPRTSLLGAGWSRASCSVPPDFCTKPVSAQPVSALKNLAGNSG